jgi:hypothetical protein
MVPRLQPHLGGVYNVEESVGLSSCWACAPDLCDVGLIVDLVLATLECDGVDCYWFVVDGEGSVCLMCRVALASDSVLKMLGRILRPMFLIGLDLVLQG